MTPDDSRSHIGCAKTRRQLDLVHLDTDISSIQFLPFSYLLVSVSAVKVTAVTVQTAQQALIKVSTANTPNGVGTKYASANQPVSIKSTNFDSSVM
jgi:hypothetical protein